MVIAERNGAVLRHAAAADLPHIAEIAVACWTPINEGNRRMIGEDLDNATAHAGGWESRKISAIQRHFERNPEGVWTLELNGGVIGFVTFDVIAARSIGEIDNNGVTPERAGEGWGTFMYRHVLDHFRSIGLRAATVSTGLDEAHAPARRAYEAVGFDRQVPHVDYWQDLRALNDGSGPRP